MADTCTCKGGEKITYRFDGSGSERKLVVSYSKDDDDWRVYFKGASFEKGDRDIDVLFSLGAIKMPGVRMPVRGELEVPLPLEIYFVPKGYSMKRMKLKVYTQLDDEKPKLKCKKDLDSAYVPVRRCWFDRLLDYFNLNNRAEPPNPHPVPLDW